MALDNQPRVYVGTYTRPLPNVAARSEGIYVFTLDPASGALAPSSVARNVTNPSFVALAPNRRYLYAVEETEETEGQPGGAVSAFAIDPASGALTFLNRQPSHGTDPCHLTVDATGSFVLVANYSSGSVACYPIRADGRLDAASDIVQHQGHSVNPQRQEGPHAHSVNLDPTNQFALVCDLGLDQVRVYRLERGTGKLVPTDPPFASLAPGSGPRHLAFHPSRPYLFVINEIASTLTAFAFDAASGALHELQTVSTLPPDYAGRNSTADVHVHPNGRFVYGSNRGHDSLAAFALDESSGRLTPLGQTPTGGHVPRNFALAPSGALLLAANQNSSNLVAFSVDGVNGSLAPTGAVTSVPTPVCIKFE